MLSSAGSREGTRGLIKILFPDAEVLQLLVILTGD